MSAPAPYETALVNLIHDLRQPLANMEGSLWCLASLLNSADVRVREQAEILARQLEAVERLLSSATDDLKRMRVQHTGSDSILEVTNSAS